MTSEATSTVPCLGHIAAERLPAVRWATKVELYHLLLRGRRFLIESRGQRSPVTGAAVAACMSPYHFNRLFRAMYGETPHTLLTRVRLAEAKRLLAETELDLSEIACRVGFSQATSLCRLFRAHGGSTAQFR